MRDCAQAPGCAILGDEGGGAELSLVLLVEEVPDLVLLYLEDLVVTSWSAVLIARW